MILSMSWLFSLIYLNQRYDENMYSLIFCMISVFYSYFGYQYFYSHMILIYFMFDIIAQFPLKRDFVFHHLYTSLIFIYRNPTNDFLRVIQLCELSTIFLNLTKMVKNKFLCDLYSLLFAVTFVGIRIIYTFYIFIPKLFEYSDHEHFLDFWPTHHWRNDHRVYTIDFYVIDFLFLLPVLCLHIYWVRLIAHKVKKTFLK